MDLPSKVGDKPQVSIRKGTLAIDLGNTTTVVAFQGEVDLIPELLDLPPITRFTGEVPSLVWQSDNQDSRFLVGNQVIQAGLLDQNDPRLSSDFKRWIGANNEIKITQSHISPNKAGEVLLLEIWKRLPKQINVCRLVLTAPVESYKAYRSWLYEVCNVLPVEEIALIDEPTAAAIGTGLNPGAKVLVIDLGGSTIDISLVALEGGEGKANPIAQLLRFRGQDLEQISQQVLRCAKVLGKAGIQLGGRDLDRWIVNHLFPKTLPSEAFLNAAERLKCRLSDESISDTQTLLEIANDPETQEGKPLRLCRNELNKLLIERGFLDTLSELLKQTLAGGRKHGSDLNDIQGVIAIGGGSKIPLFRNWLKEQTKPLPLLNAPPVEAVALGALSLTPGVIVKDVLNHGISLRCWDKRGQEHIWHPLFVAGQPWPTSSPLELVLAASNKNQLEIELFLGEPQTEGSHEVIYIDGIPTVKTLKANQNLQPWGGPTISIPLNTPAQPGEDCLRVQFNINQEGNLQIEGKDLRTGDAIKPQILGLIR